MFDRGIVSALVETGRAELVARMRAAAPGKRTAETYMARNRTSAEQTGANRSPCDVERLARAEIENRRAQPLEDQDWARQRQRLVEFVQTLARWDLEEQLRKEESDPGKAA
jgi:hypothetical protein